MDDRRHVIHPNVHLGADCQIGDYVIIGVPPASMSPGQIETHIGPGANIRSHSVIYAGNRIGAGFSAGHGVMVRVRARVRGIVGTADAVGVSSGTAPSLMVALLFVGGVQMLMLGILGEYVWRMSHQVRGRPQYIVMDEVGFDDRGDRP